MPRETSAPCRGALGAYYKRLIHALVKASDPTPAHPKLAVNWRRHPLLTPTGPLRSGQLIGQPGSNGVHPARLNFAAGTTTRSGADSDRAVTRPPRGSPSEEAVRNMRPRPPSPPGPTEPRCPACDRAWIPPRRPKTASD